MQRKSRRLAAVAALGLVIGLGVAQAAAGASIGDEELLRTVGEEGPGAGQLSLETGVASDPVTGHLYTVEGGNNRVSEFTPWGEFVKAFGWDVAPEGVNEQQEVRVRAAEGQFRLAFGGKETGDLAFDASGEEVEEALNGLSSIGPGGVAVEERAGTTDGKTPFVYLVAFKGGSLKEEDVEQLGALDGTTPLGGGSPATSLEARTRADGHGETAGFEACTGESGCKKGLKGPEAGELSEGFGVAVDGAGDVFVSEAINHRVQKFDSAGRFLGAFGNSGPGQIVSGGGLGIALCPAGKAACGAGALFVANNERIVRFSLGGSFEGEFPAPVEGEPAEAVAFDPVSEALYVTQAEKGFKAGGLHRLNASTGKEVKEPWPLVGSGPVATDAEGDVFVRYEKRVLEYDSSGGELEPPECCDATPFSLTGLSTNGAGDLDASRFSSGLDSFLDIYGPPPVQYEGAPPVPPTVLSEFVTAVAADGASVEAEINPHFFTDTRYRVQYGTGKCSEGGCTEEVPALPGLLLTTHATERALKTSEVALEGLTPGTTYHYRFVAESSGGGPSLGAEASFTTPAPLPPKQSCQNQAFRGGVAGRLPDCRAYEMVSPLDKNGGDIKALGGTQLQQAGPEGEKLAYSSYRSFGDPKGAPYTNQFIAQRDPEAGWGSEAIDPGLAVPGEPLGEFDLEATLLNPFKSFSADLCEGWLVVAADPLLDPPRDFAGYPNLYRADLCGEEGAQALVPVKPGYEAKLASHFDPEPQGASADGKEAIMRMRLEEGGPTQAYYADGSGGLELLCVLPDGTQVSENCSGGTSTDTPFISLNRLSSVAGALSADGQKAYWTDSGAAELGSGQVYLRINPGAQQSEGESCEEGKACTVAVSETATPDASRFLGATPSGEEALFEVQAGPDKGGLYRFKLGEGSTPIAGEVAGVLATSTDLSRVYLVSREALGGGAEAGAPNLYLEEGGTFTFLATLSEEDAIATSFIPTDTSSAPILHAARATADGGALAFISTKPLTGYDNTDQGSGEADSEAYLYRVGSSGPVCVSCNPGGARPRGRVVPDPLTGTQSLPTAASIPLATTQLYAPRALSADGRRLFFDSYDPLLPRDTNGKEDVYEWEEASGQADCEEKGAELYVAAAEGCLSLLSSGQSSEDSEFADASEEGRDAFFITNSSLLARDPGLYDVYDARAGGGLPEAGGGEAPCQGEACKPAPFAPESTTPSSSAYEGPGDLEEKPKKKHHKKKHKKHKKRRAGR